MSYPLLFRLLGSNAIKYDHFQSYNFKKEELSVPPSMTALLISNQSSHFMTYGPLKSVHKAK